MKNFDDEKITKKVTGVFYLIFSKQQSMYWFPKTVFRNTSRWVPWKTANL